MKIRELIFTLFLMGTVFLSSSMFAQDPEETDYAFGTVERSSATEIVVNQYDYESDAETTITYQIDPNVEVTNAKDIQSIVKGDSVDVTFIEKNGKKIAVAILIEKLAEIQVPLVEEFYEDEPDINSRADTSAE